MDYVKQRSSGRKRVRILKLEPAREPEAGRVDQGSIFDNCLAWLAWQACIPLLTGGSLLYGAVPAFWGQTCLKILQMVHWRLQPLCPGGIVSRCVLLGVAGSPLFQGS